MKTTSIISTIILVSLFAVSFSFRSTSEEQIVVKVSAPQPTEFDMYQEGGKILHGLKTPYQITVTSPNDRFIFKSHDQKTEIKVTVDKGRGAVLMGEWAVVVLLLEQDKATTFGMN